MEFVAEVGSTWWRKDRYEAKDAAIESIAVAKYCGATSVKFQLFKADKLYSKVRALKGWNQARKYELPLTWLPDLEDKATEQGVRLEASVFDLESATYAVDYLHGLKIASGDITNKGLIEGVADLCIKHRKYMTLSTGAATKLEVEEAVKLIPLKVPFVGLLECVSMYPAHMVDYNLHYIKDAPMGFVDTVGLSDHTTNCILGATAVGMGYRLFEKHFKLSSSPPCPDSPVAASPAEFDLYVATLRRAEAAVGGGEKMPCAGELSERKWARRGADGLRPLEDTVDASNV